jgi:hypothetical protein
VRRAYELLDARGGGATCPHCQTLAHLPRPAERLHYLV